MAHHSRGVGGSARVQLLRPAAVLAGIHTWDVGEVFSNADGTIQYVELVEAGGGNAETGVSGGGV